MGQRSGSSTALSMIVEATWLSQHSATTKVVTASAGSLLRWCPMPKVKDAIKLYWTVQTAMCHFMRNVASPGKRSRWSVTCAVLHCEQFAYQALQLQCTIIMTSQFAMYVWPCRLCT